MTAIKGLQESQVAALQQRYGKNVFNFERPRRLYHVLWDVVREPMFILLTIALVLYFVLGQHTEGFMMLVAILFVTAIAVYQDMRSTRALQALKQFTEPQATVIRDAIKKEIRTEDLVPGDVLVLEEGNLVPADASILQQNDLTVNESVITGESLPVEKNHTPEHNRIYQGSTINTGKCYAIVTATGNNTVLGKLGKTVTGIVTPKTALQKQVSRFVRRLAYFGLSAFAIIWLFNFLRTGMPLYSLLFALTLAMASLPEEIPVALSSFMALGAWKLSRLGIISRQPQTVESLGSVNVICLDKTGTITENRMTVKGVYEFDKDLFIEPGNKFRNSPVLLYAMLASEKHPFDEMEKAIVEAYNTYARDARIDTMEMVHEYPLEGRPPMMTHVYRQQQLHLVAGKGAAERILQVCKADDATVQKIMQYTVELAKKGYRILGVASATHSMETFPASQDDFNWKLEGLIFLYDPPRKNVRRVIRQFYEAQIEVKLLTGDYPHTAANICEQVGIRNHNRFVTGDEVMRMEDDELVRTVQSTSLFARMFPEAKLKVVNTLKATGQIVAMTGDGVNDAPALKAADIGIAMGKKGTEMAKLAADLIITDDKLQNVVRAIEHGRGVYSNLKKAIRYIISIHIPIILTASLPLLLGWKYPNIFTPIHVIFLELIMGPTCSVFYEREPVEAGIMTMPPRRQSNRLFARSEMLPSIMQGLLITAGVLSLYYYTMSAGNSLEVTRTMVFTTLLISNLLLTFVNRSLRENIFQTIHYKNNLAIWVLLISTGFILMLHLVPPVRSIFGLAPVSFNSFLLCTLVALISVGWFEIYKAIRYKRRL